MPEASGPGFRAIQRVSLAKYLRVSTVTLSWCLTAGRNWAFLRAPSQKQGFGMFRVQEMPRLSVKSINIPYLFEVSCITGLG